MEGVAEGPGLLSPAWTLAPGVGALSTTRHGPGVSRAPFDALNLAGHVGDAQSAVQANRRWLTGQLAPGVTPVWLEQVHGTAVVDLDRLADPCAATPVGDAAVTRRPGRACALLTADCLPILLWNDHATVVGAAHAGWRGLAQGVIEATVRAMGVPGASLSAWLGPCISAKFFEVGPEVREQLLRAQPSASVALRPGRGDRCYADLPALARLRLLGLGLASRAIHVDGACTFADEGRFFSYRRDGQCGRMASLIWLA
ncbi:MAG: peptidoglycan editing factor PgeF [Pseudomonadota bacterium]